MVVRIREDGGATEMQRLASKPSHRACAPSPPRSTSLRARRAPTAASGAEERVVRERRGTSLFNARQSPSTKSILSSSHYYF
ncbi:hypothetical protein GYH30_014672 [Glycine max]|nr:hypothetical protein GYH30_014672 [Glycine max]